MARRVSPTDAIHAQIDELFASGRELGTVLEEVGRLTVRLMMQTAIEAEVDAFLGRGRYERREEESAPGHRNGHQPEVAVKTTMGPVNLARPKLRDTDERFCSQLFGRAVTRTSALEALVISAWVRGLSDRDVEAALAEVLGPEAALSRSTVSRICGQLKEEFARFGEADLSGLRLDYLYLDGANFKMHEHARAEPVLVAWGIDTDGHPHLVAIEAASVGVHRRLERIPRRPGRPWAGSAAAGDLRRRPRAAGGDRDPLRRKPPPALCHPSTPQRHRQGGRGRPGRLQGRLVGASSTRSRSRPVSRPWPSAAAASMASGRTGRRPTRPPWPA